MGGKCSSFNFIDLLFFDKQTWLQLPLSAFKLFLFDLATLLLWEIVLKATNLNPQAEGYNYCNHFANLLISFGLIQFIMNSAEEE